MKTKVCPICDQPMKGIYCKGCKKIVLNPVEQNITYYLNTRHPEFETNCSYHNELPRSSSHSGQRYSGTETETKKAQIRERMAAGKQEKKAVFHPTVLNGDVIRKPNVFGANKSNSSAVKKILIGVIIYMIVCFGSVIGMIFGNIVDTFDGFELGVRTPEEVAVAVPEPDDSLALELPVPMETAPAAMEDWELTDEEVRELGVPCNSFGHIPVIFGDVMDVLHECIDDAEYNWAMSVYSYNQFIDEATWYETVYEFTIRNKEEYAGYLNINVDTATGEIHGMEMYTKYEKGFYEVADIAVKFLEQIGAAENLPSGTDFFETAYKAQGDDWVTIQNGLEVICEIPGGESEFFRMEIYAPGYYTIVEE